LPLIKEVWNRYSQTFNDVELSLLLKSALDKKPLYHNTVPLKLHSVKQVKTAPITIVLKVNKPDWFGESQLGFFENVLRQNYDLVGVPIQFVVRTK
jgi:predicted GTPase